LLDQLQSGQPVRRRGSLLNFDPLFWKCILNSPSARANELRCAGIFTSATLIYNAAPPNGGNMKRRIFCVFLIVVTFSFAGSAASQTPNKSTEQDEFRSLIDRYYTAWNTGNPDNAAPLYAQDNDLVFYDLTPLKYIGWGAYDAGFRKVIASFASASFTPQQDFKVTRRGTIAWTMVTWHLSGKKKSGEAVELDGRHTAIWENRGGKWLIVHEHFSAPLS
jgi:ketosteroid isomerase-like protein